MIGQKDIRHETQGWNVGVESSYYAIVFGRVRHWPFPESLGSFMIKGINVSAIYASRDVQIMSLDFNLGN